MARIEICERFREGDSSVSRRHMDVRSTGRDKAMSNKKKTTTPAMLSAYIERSIYFIRDCRVMLDTDLANLYGVTTFNLNKAVKRNIERFPEDFMFQLTAEELEPLKFQTGISKKGGRGGRRSIPYAFTQEGVAMLSSVLRSDQAVQVNITVMRAFVRLRRLMMSHEELAGKIAAMEKKYDARFKVVFDAIRELMKPAPKLTGRIGFRSGKR